MDNSTIRRVMGNPAALLASGCLDLQASWLPTLFDTQLQLAIGINNILDEEPPPCLSCDLNNYEGTLYPVPGRCIHARAAIRF